MGEMRRLAVIGGMGAVAREVAVRAMEAGRPVSWHIQPDDDLDDPSLETDYGEVLRIVRGAWDDEGAYHEAVSGCDAAVVALDVQHTAAERFVPVQRLVQRAMKQHAVRRVVLVTAHGSGDSSRRLDWAWWAKLNANQLRRIITGANVLCWSTVAQYTAQENVLTTATTTMGDPPFRHTILRPAAVTDGPLTGTYLATPTHVFGGYISAADVADCALKALDDEMDIDQAFSLAYSSRVA